MITPDRFANKVIDYICDGRMTYPLIEVVGFWIAQNSTTSESDARLETLADSIKDNLEKKNGYCN